MSVPAPHTALTAAAPGRSKYIELTIEETPDLNKLKEAQVRLC